MLFIIDIKIAIALNRFVEAFESWIKLIKIVHFDGGFSMVAEMQSDQKSFGFMFFLLEKLKGIKLSSSLRAEFRNCLYDIIINICDDHCVSQVKEHIFSIENEIYLRKNDRVKAAVEAGHFKSGWHHYKAAGRREGRDGFDGFMCFSGFFEKHASKKLESGVKIYG